MTESQRQGNAGIEQGVGADVSRPAGNAFASVFGADGSIIADLFCLTCGYNLRGLFGDPVRCPECGSTNDLGSALVPAHYIRNVLRAMEEAPAQCLCVSLFGLVIVPLVIVIPWPNFLPSLVVVPGMIAGWLWAFFHTRRVFGGRRGWQRIVWDFHLVALLFLSFFPLVWLGSMLNLHVMLRVRWSSYLWICGIVGFVLLLVGLRTYLVTRRRIAELQREEAIRQVKDWMREESGRDPFCRG